MKSVHEAGAASAAFARRNLEAFSSDLTAIKDPREAVKEEVIEGANMVTKELEGGVGKLNEVSRGERIRSGKNRDGRKK
jgi:hypothetical protein